jgi:hypothetical protein
MLGHPHKAPKTVKKLFDEIDNQEPRVELNLYVVGYEDEDQVPAHAPHDDEPDDHTAEGPEPSADPSVPEPEEEQS